ncbi:MAG: transketolase [Deltaproteobacteria bacterium CG11_big_fil_rev_8_21_14_0_20_45_16]|nr:MAG: transketolase [Deltaproteobacteria bacterium CG11_big_fil_rev_8_21_14_0_20_45_16]
MGSQSKIASLNPNDDKLATRLRADILKMIHSGKSGHPGGSLSCIDILISLFSGIVKCRPDDPQWSERDRVVLSKGHGVPALYAVLAELGYFPKDWLMTLRHLGSPLQGHPDVARLPAVEAATGSLGQGLSIAQGMALALKLDKMASRVFCIVGDGEIQEGQIWEAAMSAPKFKLDNLTVILDYNHGQIDGPSDEIMSLEPIVDKWKAFNWNVLEVDGHDRRAMMDVLPRQVSGRPTFVVAHTIKGKGVSFMERVIDWHGVAPNDEQLQNALEELKL